MSEVINIAERKKPKAKDDEPKLEPATEEDFKTIEERNKKNKERQEKQRHKDNQSVKRSYRLNDKPKKGK